MANFFSSVVFNHEDNELISAQKAAKDLLDKHNAMPDILFVFTSALHNQQLLLHSLRESFGNTHIVGMTTCGNIFHHGYCQKHLILTALNSSDASFISACMETEGKNVTHASAECARQLQVRCGSGSIQLILLFVNINIPNSLEVLAGFKEVFGFSVPIIGAVTGSFFHPEQSYHFNNGNLLKNSITAVAITSTYHIDISIASGCGYQPLSMTFSCKETDGFYVSKLDSMNSLQYYSEAVGKNLLHQVPDILMKYPFGLFKDKTCTEFTVRCPSEIDHENKRLKFRIPIRNESKVCLVAASRDDIVGEALKAAENAFKNLKGKKPAFVFIMSDVSRPMLLGSRKQHEFTVIQNIFGKHVTISGFYSIGEILLKNEVSQESQLDQFLQNGTIHILAIGM